MRSLTSTASVQTALFLVSLTVSSQSPLGRRCRSRALSTKTCASTLAACSQEAFTHVWALEEVSWCACTYVCALLRRHTVVCMHLRLHMLCVRVQHGSEPCPPWCLQARFSTFTWVQALDLVIVATRSGALCALPSDSGLSEQLCVSMVFASHIVITYLCPGTLVWRMDRDARQSFVRQQQHGSVEVAAT